MHTSCGIGPVLLLYLSICEEQTRVILLWQGHMELTVLCWLLLETCWPQGTDVYNDPELGLSLFSTSKALLCLLPDCVFLYNSNTMFSGCLRLSFWWLAQ